MIATNGTTLEVQQINAAGSLAIARALTVVGTGAAGTTGAIEMLGGGNGINTLSGTVALIGDTTVGVDVGQLTISGSISGAAGLTKVGLGMLTLSTAANSYNGVTTISAGILEANLATSLGAITAGTVVANGATLDVLNVTVVGEQLTLTGTGFGSLVTGSNFVQARGALLFTGGGTWNGNISSSADVVINTNGGGSIVNGIISGTNLTKLGSNQLTLNAANTFTGNVTVMAGTLALGNANTYTGTTTVQGGAANGLTLQGYGTILNTTGPIVVNTGGNLTLDNGTNGGDRPADQPHRLDHGHHAHRRHAATSLPTTTSTSPPPRRSAPSPWPAASPPSRWATRRLPCPVPPPRSPVPV